MPEVEVAIKVKQSQEECENLLKAGGYELLFNTETHDVYFSNRIITQEMTEQEIKYSCIMFRHTKGTCGFDNFNLYNNSKPNSFKCDLVEASGIILQLINSGYIKVLDTFKTDYIYKKDNAYHQLQNIRGIGLLDYYYDEDIFQKSQSEQFEILKANMLKLGFELEYEEGVDKFRTFLNGNLCFSKNQNGNYNLTQTENS